MNKIIMCYVKGTKMSGIIYNHQRKDLGTLAYLPPDIHQVLHSMLTNKPFDLTLGMSKISKKDNYNKAVGRDLARSRMKAYFATVHSLTYYNSFSESDIEMSLMLEDRETGEIFFVEGYHSSPSSDVAIVNWAL